MQLKSSSPVTRNNFDKVAQADFTDFFPANWYKWDGLSCQHPLVGLALTLNKELTLDEVKVF